MENPFYIISIGVTICIFAIEYLELIIGKSEYIFFSDELIKVFNKIIDGKEKKK